MYTNPLTLKREAKKLKEELEISDEMIKCSIIEKIYSPERIVFQLGINRICEMFSRHFDNPLELRNFLQERILYLKRNS